VRAGARRFGGIFLYGVAYLSIGADLANPEKLQYPGHPAMGTRVTQGKHDFSVLLSINRRTTVPTLRLQDDRSKWAVCGLIRASISTSSGLIDVPITTRILGLAVLGGEQNTNAAGEAVSHPFPRRVGQLVDSRSILRVDGNAGDGLSGLPRARHC
jgi:hypothetical protein